MPTATRFTRSTGDCAVEERLLELLRVELPLTEAFRLEVLLPAAFFAALPLRPADLPAPREALLDVSLLDISLLDISLLRLALRGALLLPERLAEPDLVALPFLRVPVFAALLFRAPVFAPVFAPVLALLFRAAVFAPLVLPAPVRELDFRAPEVGPAALRAALSRRGDALDALDLDEDLDDEDERLDVLPVREPALRLELLGDDFFVAML